MLKTLLNKGTSLFKKILRLKKIYLITISATFIVITIFLINSGFSTSVSSIPCYSVKNDKFLISTTESGEIEAEISKTISSPRVRYRLKIVYLIPEGTYVKPGEVVVRFDLSEAMVQLEDIKSKYELMLSEKKKSIANQKSADAQSESALKSAELSFEMAKLNVDKVKFESQAEQQASKLQFEKEKLSFKQAQLDYELKKIIRDSETQKLNIEIMQHKNDLERAQKDIEMLEVKAESEGLIIYQKNWQGGKSQKFAVGDETYGGSPIMTLPDLSHMISTTYVNEVDVSKIKIGQKVLVTLDAFRDSVFLGQISSVSTLGKKKSPESSVKVFDIIVRIKGRSEILKPGMTSSNKIIISEVKKAISIPLEALFIKDNGVVVYVKHGSTFDERFVEVGEKSEDFVIIKSGLKEGEEVALINPNDDLSKAEEKNGVSIPASGK